MSNQKIIDAISAMVDKSNAEYKDYTSKQLAEIRHRMRKLQKDECARNGCHSPQVGQFCQPHFEEERIRQRGYQQRRRLKKKECAS